MHQSRAAAVRYLDAGGFTGSCKTTLLRHTLVLPDLYDTFNGWKGKEVARLLVLSGHRVTE